MGAVSNFGNGDNQKERKKEAKLNDGTIKDSKK